MLIRQLLEFEPFSLGQEHRCQQSGDHDNSVDSQYSLGSLFEEGVNKCDANYSADFTASSRYTMARRPEAGREEFRGDNETGLDVDTLLR
jgi:hypothetical protein